MAEVQKLHNQGYAKIHPDKDMQDQGISPIPDHCDCKTHQTERQSL